MIAPILAEVEVDGDLHPVPADLFVSLFHPFKTNIEPGTVILHLRNVKDKNVDPDLLNYHSHGVGQERRTMMAMFS